MDTTTPALLSYKTSTDPNKNFIKTCENRFHAINAALDCYIGDFGITIFDIRIDGIPTTESELIAEHKHIEYMLEDPLSE
jgi:hypothetical protein